MCSNYFYGPCQRLLLLLKPSWMRIHRVYIILFYETQAYYLTSILQTYSKLSSLSYLSNSTIDIINFDVNLSQGL